jgi:hypothetical protein
MSENNNTTTPHMRKRRQGQRMTAEERKQAQEVFLQSFALTANVRAACMKAGIDRSQIYRWQEHDQDFSFRFKQASEDANDMVRAELFRRAVQGYEKPLVSMGRVVLDENTKEPLKEKVYSDQLLALLAKARLPEFRDKQQIEANINHSGSIDTRNALTFNPKALTDEELQAMKEVLLKAAQREEEE